MILSSACHNHNGLRERYALAATLVGRNSPISYKPTKANRPFLSDIKPREHSLSQYVIKRLD